MRTITILALLLASLPARAEQAILIGQSMVGGGFLECRYRTADGRTYGLTVPITRGCPGSINV